RAVGQGGSGRPGECAGGVGRGLPGGAAVGGQGQGGEVAQHPVDVRVQVAPVEQGEGDAERGLAGPSRQDLPVAGQQEGRGGDAGGAGQVGEGGPFPRGEPVGPPGGAGPGGLRRVGGQRQGGGGGQFGEAAPPVLPVAVAPVRVGAE